MQPIGVSWPVEYAIRKQYGIAEGRMNAFKLAIESGGDVARLEEEQKDQEEIVQRRLAANPEGIMKEGTLARVYHDSYIAALREAIEILKGVTAIE